MANLLNEYRRRHKLDFVWAINDGVCFFTKSGMLPVICVTSDNTRPVGTCKRCNTLNTTLVAECFTLGDTDHAKECVLHDHINPDADICKLVTSNIGEGYKPYMARSQREIEVWLWDYFLQFKPFASARGWRELREEQRESNEDHFDKAVTQMLWAAKTQPHIYRYYYERVYQPLLLGRKYMLMK